MKTITLTICLFLSFFMLQAQDDLTGVYNMGAANTKIEITENESIYTGTVASSDKLKPGMVMLKDIKSVDGEWKGKLYNAKKKKWYDAVLVEKGNQLMVKVSAGLVSKTLEWTKE